MSESYKAAAEATAEELATRQPHELLIILSSFLAILLTVVLTGVRWAQGIPPSEAPSAAVVFVNNLALGGVLWVASRMIRRNLVNGALVAGSVSLILIWFGGFAGLLGGLLGLLGAIVAGATHYRSWLRP